MDVQTIKESLREEIGKLERAVSALDEIEGGNSIKRSGARRMSAAGRKRISMAAKARWAKIKKAKT